MKTVKIAVTYEKGGCGKTTTAVNVSAILAQRGYRVLLADLDFQSYATSYYNMYDDEKPSIFEVMQGIIGACAAVRETEFDNLYLLPAKFDFKGIETFLMMKTKRQEYTLQSVLEPIEDGFDFIIFDCPPNGERIKENALACCDYVILPAIPDDYAVHGLLCIAKEILEVKQYVNPKIQVMGPLITMYENNANKKAYTEALCRQTIFPCFETRIRKNTTLSEAINHHKPINKYNRRCNGNIDYNRLTEEILSKLNLESERSVR